MLTSIHNESTFESAIIQSLLEQGGYMETTAPDFSRELALDKKQLIPFLKDTRVLDQIIVTKKGYSSFQELGLIE